MVNKHFLQIHHIEPVSYSNGPGKRAVIWFQGCTLNCGGCFNPLTHSKTGGRRISAEGVLQILKRDLPSIDGITISGGEPFQQLPGLIFLLDTLHKQSPTTSVVLFSGYSWEELTGLPGVDQVLDHVDLLLAGRYIESRRVASGLLGSANKTIHYLTNRYSPTDLASTPESEILILPDGTITISGISPINW